MSEVRIPQLKGAGDAQASPNPTGVRGCQHSRPPDSNGEMAEWSKAPAC